MLRVVPVEGEPTRYWVESNTCVCTNPQCKAAYNRRKAHEIVLGFRDWTARLGVGEPCPRCVAEALKKLYPRGASRWQYVLAWAKCRSRMEPGEVRRMAADLARRSGLVVGELDERFHVVDLATYHGNGSCGCEYFQCSLEPELRLLPPEMQSEGRYRDQHILAARDRFTDAVLGAHERLRHAKAGRQREEDQP